MARMYPISLKEPVASGVERELFHLFRERLPDDYRVFHGVDWRRRDREQRFADRRGEVDFVVAHPRFGLLLLEAKGGGVRVDGGAGRWYSTDANGCEHEIDDPFEQVDRNLYAILQLLAEAETTRRFGYRCQTGVAFIQTIVTGGLAPHAPRSAVLDSADLADLEGAVKRMFGPALEHPLPPEALEAITQWLTPSHEFVKIGLNAKFEEIDRTRLSPTESQAWLLDHFEAVSRAAVAGCAGSGKTLLAVEKARHLARAGLSVLFVCFNKNLARWVEGSIHDGSYPLNRVKVRHFHGLADEACAAAGSQLFPNRSEPDWENVPARVEAALRRAPMKFDAIVADEGQDFQDDWWLLLMGEMLVEPDRGPFYVFYDANQRIYRSRLQLPASLPEYPLNANLRNTRQIHDEVVRYYRGERVPRSAGPDGVEVVRIGEATLKGVQQALDELINQQRVPAGEIIVLTGRSQDRSDLTEGRRLGNVALTWLPPARGEVQVMTVQSFKGLEKRVVILTELDYTVRDASKREYGASLMYIGASRATHHLVLVGKEMPEPV